MYVLFLVYLCIFSWLLVKSRFIISSGISKKALIALFVVKVIAGCCFYWVLLKTGTSMDTQGYHLSGIDEYHLLFNHPKEYLINLFTSGYSNAYGGVLSSTNSYWKDLSGNIIVKFLSVCDIFSRGNYFINEIIYNYVIFFGTIALYRVFNTIFKNNDALIIITCFLLPSLLFYSSTIHKEGLLLAALGVVIFNCNALLKKGNSKAKHITWLLLALAFIFAMRAYIFTALLPALFAWMLSSVKKYNAWYVFVITYLVGAIIFFNIQVFFPAINLPQSVANKQESFEQLGASHTYIGIDTLKPTFISFVCNAPQAFSHSMLRPYFTDYGKSHFLWVFIIELVTYQILLAVFIFCKNKNISYKEPFIVFGIFFSLSMLLIIGYTVPIIGAIVRYRSIYLPFLLTPLVCSINWQKLTPILQVKK